MRTRTSAWNWLPGVVIFIVSLLSIRLLPAEDGKHIAEAAPLASTQSIPVTTTLPAAGKLFEEAMEDYEKLYLDETQAKLAAAIRADPNFALAYAFQAYFALDPALGASSRERAKALEQNVTHGEQLEIEWIVCQQDSDFVCAISSMNDMLAAYPSDKRARMFAGEWLYNQQQYEQSERVLEAALKIDPNYAAAWNDLGYAYIAQAKVDDAVAALKKYVALMPGEPNPHDSLAEISRMAGRYQDALTEYRESLSIQPKFVVSQVGLGDTYSLIGDQKQARAEFAKALAMTDSPEQRLSYRFQNALTYVREKDFQSADKEFTQLAGDAHEAGMADLESQAYRAMAIYTPDVNRAVQFVDQANLSLRHGHKTAQSLVDDELAQNLRVRVFRLAAAGRSDEAESAVKLLAVVADENRNEIVQHSYHAALGAVDIANGKYTDALGELQEDSDDAISMTWLSSACNKAGNAADARAAADRAMSLHRPTIEDAVARLTS